MEISELLEIVRELPPSARILPRLQNLLKSEHGDTADIVELLKVDAALTAQVLRFSNSAYFSVGQPCDSVDQAVQRLGFNTVYQLVATAASHTLLNPPLQLYHLRKGELMIRSLALAVFCEELNKELRVQDRTEALYTAGLLHGIGKVAINQAFQSKGFEIYDLDDDKPMNSALEMRIVGFTHSEAGFALLEHWRFSSVISELIRYQNTPEKAPVVPELARILNFGKRALVSLLDDEVAPTFLAEDPDMEKFGLTPDVAEGLVLKVRAEISEFDRQL